MNARQKLVRRAARVFLVAVAGVLLEGAWIICDGLWDRPGRADVALVLGNEIAADGGPSPRLRARLDRAVEGYRHGDFPEIIASGGVERDGRNEAVVMRGYLVAQGVPAANVLADDHGINTYESARYTAGAMRAHGWHAACVVTQYYHVPRARLALERFGVQPVYAAHARYFEVRDGYAILREIVGYPKYLLRRYDL